MYKVGEYIIYGGNGVCLVKDYTKMNFAGSSRDYYVLLPVRSNASIIYSPFDNSKVPMRRIMRKEEAEELLTNVSQLKDMVIEDSRNQEQVYKNILTNCTVEDNARFVKAMYEKKAERESRGKKNTAIDEKYLYLAKDCLVNELALALNLEIEEADQKLEAALRK